MRTLDAQLVLYRSRSHSSQKQVRVNTNYAAKVRECTGLDPPSPRPSPPLTRGERAGSGGDSARAGICELWLGDW